MPPRWGSKDEPAKPPEPAKPSEPVKVDPPVPLMDLQEFKLVCRREAELRKFFTALADRAEALQQTEALQGKAERARDAAFLERDKALAEIAAKQAKYEREVKAALDDLARVTQEKAEVAAREQLKLRDALAQVRNEVDKTNELSRLAAADLAAFRRDAEREMAATTARIEALRAEERVIKERFAAALK